MNKEMEEEKLEKHIKDLVIRHFASIGMILGLEIVYDSNDFKCCKITPDLFIHGMDLNDLFFISQYPRDFQENQKKINLINQQIWSLIEKDNLEKCIDKKEETKKERFKL